jgi:ribonucleoside-triphosphate reductase
MYKIKKRNGNLADYNGIKIVNAISKANNEVDDLYKISSVQIAKIESDIRLKVIMATEPVTVEQIQDEVVNGLLKWGAEGVLALTYERYRQNHGIARQFKDMQTNILEIIDGINEEAIDENSNKNAYINSTQRDYMAGETSKFITDSVLLPKDLIKAHKEGIIHVHDRDYFAQHEHNCELINLEDMLQNGTVITGTLIEKPKSFRTAANVATQIVAQVASNQYGGQSFSLAHLAPFVDVSRKKIYAHVLRRFEDANINASPEQINKVVEEQLMEEVRDGIQTIQYQLVTLMTCNGQTPFVTMYMYLDEVPEGQTRDDLAMLIEEVLNQRIKGIKNEKGVYVTPAFPKLIYVLDEDNIHEDSKYYYLTELAAKCTAKRMVPDYISAKIMKEVKGDVYTCMGCRSFLTVEDSIRNPDGSHKFYGRFNQGVCTINLVDVACSAVKASEENMTDRFDEFWKIFDERLEMCHRVLQIRHKRLEGTKSDVAPILWQYGALARLKKGETIDKLLYGGYSTISLGYGGLYECCVEMTGHSHTDPETQPFALQIMQHMNDKCKEWRDAENIAYSLYGTPMESTTYTFAKGLQKRFGIIPGVTDHDYITNSYHVNVREKIDWAKKLEFESEFQKLSPGGCISYVEVPNLQNNIPAVLSMMKFIYDHIMYAELNTKSDYCMKCGYDGEIRTVRDEKTHKLVWECPNCGNRDQNMMSVARRTCGYIGSQYWNQGRTEEIRDRVLHVATAEIDGRDLNANATK